MVLFRLRQFGFHDGGDHGGGFALLQRGDCAGASAGARVVGHGVGYLAGDRVAHLAADWSGGRRARAQKKTFLLLTAAVCALGTAGLFGVGPGDIWLALGLVMVANVAFAMSENLCGSINGVGSTNGVRPSNIVFSGR